VRRTLAWLVAIPLMLAGFQAAHAFAYRLVYPNPDVRARVLHATGHGYLHYAPFVLGLAGALLLVSLLVAVTNSRRGRSLQALPAWAFGLPLPLAYALQEHTERALHTGVLPWSTMLGPMFLPGLALQFPFACVAYLAARLLLGAAERVGRALTSVSPPPGRRPAAPALQLWVEPELPRPALLGWNMAERGPPPLALPE
jgi:hypothetical protein